MPTEERGLLRLPLDCAFDEAWTRGPDGRMTCDEDAEDAAAVAYAAKHGCTAQLLLREGPAGGNPLYCFFGTRTALLGLCTSHVGGDVEEADYLMEAVAPLGVPVPELRGRVW